MYARWIFPRRNFRYRNRRHDISKISINEPSLPTTSNWSWLNTGRHRHQRDVACHLPATSDFVFSVIRCINPSECYTKQLLVLWCQYCCHFVSIFNIFVINWTRVCTLWNKELPCTLALYNWVIIFIYIFIHQNSSIKRRNAYIQNIYNEQERKQKKREIMN